MDMVAMVVMVAMDEVARPLSLLHHLCARS
jgi:hypothetical protein